MATLLPLPEIQIVDGNGSPLAGGTILTYVPNGTTPKQTWQDAGQTILNTNPIVLDGAGRAIVYGSGSYRFVISDANGNLVYDQVTADTSAGLATFGGTSTGTPNAQIVSAGSFSAQDGQQVSFIVGAGLTNTGGTTVAPGGGSGIAILKDTVSGPTALTGGELVAGNVAILVYDATRGAFHLVDTPQVANFGGPLTSIASNTTTDLGSVLSHNIQITGTNTINLFGSSASTMNPLYQITFQSALLLTYNATSMITPGAQNIPVSAGDSAVALYLGSGNWVILSYSFARSTPNVPIFGQCQLTRTSNTVVTLLPYQGHFVSFPSGSIATIPSAGVAATITSLYINGTPGQTLTATTLYYAYLWLNSGVPTLDFSTTSHATDSTTGIEIKNGDATRALIGMVYPATGPVFSDSSTARTVASWFNRKTKQLASAFTATRSTSSGTFIELNAEIRAGFLSWGDGMSAAFAGSSTSSSTGTNTNGVSLDSLTTAGNIFVASANEASGATDMNMSVTGNFAPAEGFHYVTLMALAAGTGSWPITNNRGQMSGTVVN